MACRCVSTTITSLSHLRTNDLLVSCTTVLLTLVVNGTRTRSVKQNSCSWHSSSLLSFCARMAPLWLKCSDPLSTTSSCGSWINSSNPSLPPSLLPLVLLRPKFSLCAVDTWHQRRLTRACWTHVTCSKRSKLNRASWNKKRSCSLT